MDIDLGKLYIKIVKARHIAYGKGREIIRKRWRQKLAFKYPFCCPSLSFLQSPP